MINLRVSNILLFISILNSLSFLGCVQDDLSDYYEFELIPAPDLSSPFLAGKNTEKGDFRDFPGAPSLIPALIPANSIPPLTPIFPDSDRSDSADSPIPDVGALPVAAVVAVPVPVGPPGEIGDKECEEDGDCSSDNPCLEFTCIKEQCVGFSIPGCNFCEQDSDCQNEEVCVDNRCQIAAAFTVGGAITGLTSSGLIIQNNGGDNLSIPANATSFQFSALVAEGDSYDVTILTQPSGQSCTLSNASGTNVMTNITNIIVTCGASVSFTIGGAITGLTTSGLILQNNGGDDLSVAANATSFQFATPVAEGGSYDVTILTQPTGQTCTLSNASGTNVMNNITNIIVTCATTVGFTIGGALTGLTTSGLILQNNGGDNLSVLANATSFQFATPVAQGGSYDVTILTQPIGQSCTLTNATGTNVTANITNVIVICTTPLSFTIGGVVAGLNSSGLILQNNGSDDLSIPANATSLIFGTSIPAGGSYNVTILSQPTGQNCTLSNASGTDVMENITNVTVSCGAPLSFTIGGAISGLTTSGLILQNNDGDNLSIAANASSFQFSTPVAQGSSYNVTILEQAAGISCRVNNASGANVMENITNVVITCGAFATFTIGGSLVGLTTDTLVLQNDGGDNLELFAGATSFQFATSVVEGASYSVTAHLQPEGLTCTVSNANGSNITANVTNVVVTCVSLESFTIGGDVRGLTSSGLILQNNGSDNLSIAANVTIFQFADPVPAGGSYNITIFEQPSGLNCILSNAFGNDVMIDITNVMVSCSAVDSRIAFSEIILP